MTQHNSPKLIVANKVVAVLLILANIYFIPLSFILLKSKGGPFGYGLLAVPITLSVNLLLISARYSFKSRFNGSYEILMLNCLGLCWAVFWFWLFGTGPLLD